MMGLRGESMNPMTFGNMTHPRQGLTYCKDMRKYAHNTTYLSLVVKIYCLVLMGLIGPSSPPPPPHGGPII